MNLDLLSCVLYQGAPPTGAILASLNFSFRDVTNSVSNALTYPYLNLNGHTLEIATSTLVTPVPFFVLRIITEVHDGSV